jgi:hypothetical protein
MQEPLGGDSLWPERGPNGSAVLRALLVGACLLGVERRPSGARRRLRALDQRPVLPLDHRPASARHTGQLEDGRTGDALQLGGGSA